MPPAPHRPHRRPQTCRLRLRGCGAASASRRRARAPRPRHGARSAAPSPGRELRARSAATASRNSGRMKRISFVRLPGRTRQQRRIGRNAEPRAQGITARHRLGPLDHRMADKRPPAAHVARRTALRTETAPARDRNNAPSSWRDRAARPRPAAPHSSRCGSIGSMRLRRCAMRWVKSGLSITTTASGRVRSAKSAACFTRRRIAGMRGTTSRRPITAVASSGKRLSRSLRAPSPARRRRRWTDLPRDRFQTRHQLRAQLVAGWLAADEHERQRTCGQVRHCASPGYASRL